MRIISILLGLFLLPGGFFIVSIILFQTLKLYLSLKFFDSLSFQKSKDENEIEFNLDDYEVNKKNFIIRSGYQYVGLYKFKNGSSSTKNPFTNIYRNNNRFIFDNYYYNSKNELINYQSIIYFSKDKIIIHQNRSLGIFLIPRTNNYEILQNFDLEKLLAVHKVETQNLKDVDELIDEESIKKAVIKLHKNSLEDFINKKYLIYNKKRQFYHLTFEGSFWIELRKIKNSQLIKKIQTFFSKL